MNAATVVFIVNTLLCNISLGYDTDSTDIIYYSNELYLDPIPELGFHHEPNVLVLPINGAVFYNKIKHGGTEILVVSKMNLLYQYYCLRFYEKTGKYDKKIKQLLDDPETFEMYKKNSKYSSFLPILNPDKDMSTPFINKIETMWF